LPIQAFAAAVAIGISLGLLGGGGSILTVPVLVYWARMPPLEATYSSLVVVGLTSSSAAVQHAIRGHLNLRAALLFAATGIPASFVGSLLSRRLPGKALLLLFACVMIVAGLAMLFRRQYTPTGEVSVARVLAAGIGVGVLTGFFGVGGGFLVVPTLVLFAGLPMADAVGTSVAVIAFNCAGGFAGRFSSAAPIHWIQTIEFSLVAIGGSFVGAFLVSKTPVLTLRRLFAVFVLGVAAFMIVREA
jgi:uncharacterized membrane protein YfcA